MIRAGNSVAISWPTNALDFVLQAADTFSPVNWADMTTTVAVVGSENTLTNYVTGTNEFFRLRQPWSPQSEH